VICVGIINFGLRKAVPLCCQCWLQGGFWYLWVSLVSFVILVIDFLCFGPENVVPLQLFPISPDSMSWPQNQNRCEQNAELWQYFDPEEFGILDGFSNGTSYLKRMN
jgi:hypothetical protein